MKNAQRDFLKSVNVESETDALRNCVGAAFQRNKIYKENINQNQRENLRCDLKGELLTIAELYKKKSVSENEHENNIQELSERLTKKHSKILNKDRFNLGTSQKALNLFLKFLWCLERLPSGIEPVHCPLDRIILKKASIYEAWTKLDDIKLYREWICKIRTKTKTVSLSVLELEQWSQFVARNQLN